MSANGWLQFAIFCIILLATVRPVGIYMARVLEGERTWLDPVLRPFERLIYKLCAVNADKDFELAYLYAEYTGGHRQLPQRYTQRSSRPNTCSPQSQVATMAGKRLLPLPE